MTKSDVLHIRVKPEVKEKAEKTLNLLGLSISEAINVFLNQVILNQGIPFKIENPKYNQKTIETLEDVKKEKNVSKTFNTVDEMFKELDN